MTKSRGQEGDVRGGNVQNRFGEIDDLVLHLKGLVLVRELLVGRGASTQEIDTHSAEIERVRDRLARAVSETGDAYGVAA